jgi:predicted esterase
MPPTAFVGIAGSYDPSFLSGDPRRDLVRISPARCQALNAYTHIGGNPDLRVSLLHGTGDPAVPPEMSIAFGDALVAAGDDVALTLIEEYGHEVPTPGSEAFDAIVEETAGVACARGLANSCR